MRTDAFSTCHPVVTFAFFASVIVPVSYTHLTLPTNSLV